MRLFLALMALAALAALAGCESNEDQEARFQVARAACIDLASKAAVNITPGSFTSANEQLAHRIIDDCLEKKGFKLAKR